MSDGRCQNCREPVAAGMLICPTCGCNLAAPLVAHPGEPGLSPAGIACSQCGTLNDASGRPFCTQCLTSLPVNASQWAATAPTRLVFDLGVELVLEPGMEVTLGRDPVTSPVASSLCQFDTVSRIHATVGRDGTGAVWIRDEGATNATYVNRKPVQKGATVPLTSGDEIRLSSAVAARLQVG